MYTGIVRACLPIASIEKLDNLSRFSIIFSDKLLFELELGASVAVNGVCLTVSEILGSSVFFDVIKETLDLSNLKYLEKETLVNIERSAKADAEIGGHPISGHVVGTAEVATIEKPVNNYRLTFTSEKPWLKFIFEKGYLSVNGCSLTVAEVNRNAQQFSINLIPETLSRTNFRLLQVGDEVNVEVESQTQTIVETVERILDERFGAETKKA
tara:strand:- start:5577 stop:6212 length:636 start_codon:yes stop_codon:yes gene_type:complete